MLRKIKGQSTLEYAILIAVIIAALLAMQNFVKRGVQGRLRSTAVDVAGGSEYDLYEPGYTNTDEQVTSTTTVTTSTSGGTTTRNQNETRTVTGSHNIKELEHSWWPGQE
jgi:exopolysaccharide biosynthesis protein